MRYFLLLGLLLHSAIACSPTQAFPPPPPRTSPPVSPLKPIVRPFPEAFQKGICYAHAWEDADRGGYGTDKDHQTLKRLQALGVSWISLTPFFFQNSRTSEKISGTSAQMKRAESDDRVLATARAAHQLGIKVLLKPHLWVGDNSWCGTISPPDWKVWMASYQEVVVQYARLAQTIDADGLIIGNELGSATQADPEGFRTAIQAARSLYSGPISYAANWDEVERVTFWDDLDAIGVNAYWPLTRDKNATDDARYAGALQIDAQLLALSQKTHRPVLITEIGYRSVAGSDLDPHTWPENDQERPVDFDTQASAYAAVLKAFWNKPHIKGIYFWKVISDGDWREDGGQRGFSPLGKPAETVLRQYFRRLDLQPPDGPRPDLQLSVPPTLAVERLDTPPSSRAQPSMRGTQK